MDKILQLATYPTIFLDKGVPLNKRLALLMPQAVVIFTCFFIVLASFTFIKLKREQERSLKEEMMILSQALLNSLNSTELRRIKNPQLMLKGAIEHVFPGNRSYGKAHFALIEKGIIVAEQGDFLGLQLKQAMPTSMATHVFIHQDDVKIESIFNNYAAYTYLTLREEEKTILIARDASRVTFLGSALLISLIILSGGTLLVFYGFAFSFIKMNRDTKVLAHAAQTRKHYSNQDKSLKETLDILPSGLCLWNAEDQLVLCNKAFAELHYAKPEDFRIGMHRSETLTRLIGPRSSLISPSIGEDKETSIQPMSDGRILQITSHRTEEGGFASIVVDITDLKNHETELTAKKNELLSRVSDLERMKEGLEIQKAELGDLTRRLSYEKIRAEAASEAKSEFLAHMSHDLRTPLNHVIAFAEIMKMRHFGELNNELYEEYPEIIHRSGLQLLSQVNDILDVSKIEKGMMSITKIDTTLSDILDETLPAIDNQMKNKQQVLIVNIEPEIKLYADPRAMRLMLQNLLSNASKFTPDFGEIRIIAKACSKNLTLIVKDTGEGIEPEVLAQLCKPFVQGENAYSRHHQGSGLGLFITKSLVEMHGGELQISSILNQGTAMIITIPLSDG